ncbi:twitching motility protein PilT [Nesterenkonia alkaliphila]|uniref:Twitching motility protein PilT n=1 Tax=Nesterenkonia alkaliphila TaxID=1463631 RepID=A0A7K1UMM2_9MICC|nr:twitching motility protein PilT [Nesterenkonia alkaliphila]MVT27696.1 twitching motility protein PilT [Nesterenkonia alkaliphila]GFZ87828.1 hypothetical protein GCM10011359_16440 [Nesterenkonia alkaliphila]
MNLGLTYDTGALIGAERDSPLVWALHKRALQQDERPTVPAGVLAEAWRGGPQPKLSLLLKSCRIEDLTQSQAREVGRLSAASGVSDPVDVSVVEGGLRRSDHVVTSNRTQIEQVTQAAGKQLRIVDV